jgi:mRNA interferase MazF
MVTVGAPGDPGKSRPAVVIQSDLLDETNSVLPCVRTALERDAPYYRVAVAPLPETGLRQSSQIVMDKIVAIKRSKLAWCLAVWMHRAFWRLFGRSGW